MATIDFTKGLNFSPLERLGLSKEEAIKFLAAMAPVIDLEFQSRVRRAFSEEEMNAIDTEAQDKGIKPEDGTFLLEEKYHEKTGNFFMEEMRLLFNEYIVHAANILTQARSDTETFAASGQETIKKFDTLMKERKWEEAAKFLDETLNSVSATPQQ